jgi:hypothetical protein
MDTSWQESQADPEAMAYYGVIPESLAFVLEEQSG